MKKNKLILLIVVGILLVAGLTVFALTRNSVRAATAYSYCPQLTCNLVFLPDTKYCGDTCDQCKKTIPHTWGEYTRVDGENHSRTCTMCGEIDTDPHNVTTWRIALGAACHEGNCTECNGLVAQEHDFKYIKNNTENHILGCTICSVEEEGITEDHVDEDGDVICDLCEDIVAHDCYDRGGAGDAYSGPNGKCDKCGATVAHNFEDGTCTICNVTCYHTHSTTTEVCSICSETISSEPGTSHTCMEGFDLSSDGDYHWFNCTYCGEPMEETKQACTYGWVEGKSYLSADKKNHGLYCTVCKKYARSEPLVDANNDGKCDIEGCGHNSDEGSTCVHVWDKIEGSEKHTCINGCGTSETHNFEYAQLEDPSYAYHGEKCTECGVYNNSLLDHVFLNGNVCNGCGFTCDHKAEYLLEWRYVSKEGCIKKCHCGGEAEPLTPHDWKAGTVDLYRGTHERTCERCGETETHNNKYLEKRGGIDCEDEIWWVYGCDECDFYFEQEETPRGHTQENMPATPATCTEDGQTTWVRCQECHAVIVAPIKIQATGHNVTTATNNDDGTHTGICTNCNQPITDNHIDENNDNSCDICGYTNSTHTHTEKTTYEKDGTHHWKICSDTTCGLEIAGTRAAHKYENGKCACGIECQHEDTTQKSDDTYHWDECDVCGEKLNKKEHSYKDGECECGKKEDKKDEEECKHENKTPKSDDTYHWDECDVCGEKLNKKEHSYKDGECECGKKEDKKDEEECKHTNKEWKSDKDEHWQICKECEEEITGTRGKHENVDGKCKNCGLKDGSTSGSILPNTGIATTAVIGTVLAGFTLLGAVKMKKYKDI